MKHTHSDRLERWLGAEQVAAVSNAMREFYGPIAVHGVPGNVHVMPGGDFTGEILAGQEGSALDRASDSLRRFRRAQRARMAMSRRQLGAFSNLSALIAAATGGKAQNLIFQKVGTGGFAASSVMDLFYVGNAPTAGSAGAAAPGGTALTSASAGALAFANPTNANTTHFVTGYSMAAVQTGTLLLYDRLFSVAKTASSSATEAVTGTFSRYQNTTAGAVDYIGNNFCFPSVSATIANAAHNWTVCQYTDQAGNTANSFPSIAGVASATTANLVDLTAPSWFMPLAAGDVGVKALTQMQCSSAVLTGSVNFNVGHPIAFFPCPLTNMLCVADGINTAFNLTTIYDSACLAFLELKASSTATTYTGMLTVVAE